MRADINSSLKGFISRLDMVGERISEFEDRSTEISQAETQGEK